MTVGVGDSVGVWVNVGVPVGVLLGGSVGVTSTKSALTVTFSNGDNTSPVGNVLDGSGVDVMIRVAASTVGASVFSASSTGPLLGNVSVLQAANRTTTSAVKNFLIVIVSIVVVYS